MESARQDSQTWGYSCGSFDTAHRCVIGEGDLHDWVDGPILKKMTDEALPFQLLATQAVDAVIATTSSATFAAFAKEGDLRSSTIAAFELLLIDLDKPLCRTARAALAAMLLRHLSTTGLLSPRDILKFATTHSAKLAETFRARPELISSDAELADIINL